MRIIISIMLIVIAAFPGFSEVEVRAGGNANITFIELPKADGMAEAIASPEAKSYYGIGWEVIFNRIGFGGNYAVNFARDTNKMWTMDWLAEAIYVSWHLFGTGAFFDLFGNAGIGCAGSAFLGNSYEEAEHLAAEDLLISIYPFLSAGLAFNLSGMVIGAKVTYMPTSSPVPVTPIDPYPMNNFNVSVFIEFSHVFKRCECKDENKKTEAADESVEG